MIGSLNEQGVLLIIEITLGVLVPIVLVSNEAVRHSRTGLFIISYSTLIGVILNRMNVAITGMGATREVSYFPGIPELLISGFLIALSFIAYAAIARVVPAFEQTSSMPGRVRRGVPLHAKA
jgi:Ni/Fe-hydrogenase subunit HybB-like protein